MPIDSRETGKKIVRRLYGSLEGFEFDTFLKGDPNHPNKEEWFNLADFVIEGEGVDSLDKSDLFANRSILAYIKFQDGPIKEVGINGIQIEDLIELAHLRLKNIAYMSSDNPDAWTKAAISYLEQASSHLMDRKKYRLMKAIEGTSQEPGEAPAVMAIPTPVENTVGFSAPSVEDIIKLKLD